MSDDNFKTKNEIQSELKELGKELQEINQEADEIMIDFKKQQIENYEY